jgi:prolyl-tRNA synthetase
MEEVERKLTDAGLVRRVGGEIAYTPQGKKLKTVVEEKVRTNLESLGAEEIELPTLVNYSQLQLDRRIELARYFSSFRTTSAEGNKLLLARTSEELATDYFLQGDEQDGIIYQINAKFRNEDASELGFLRRKEFTMLDAYSFDANIEGMRKNYQRVRKVFSGLLRELEISFSMRDATEDCSFKVPSEEFLCGSDGLQELELGHIFELGDIYTKPYESNLMMGSYGLGIDRLVAAVALSEQEGRI